MFPKIKYSNTILWAWMALCAVQAFLLYLQHIDWFYICVDIGIQSFFICTGIFFQVNILKYFRPRQNNIKIIFIWLFLFSFVEIFCINQVLKLFILKKDNYWIFYNQFYFIRYLFGFLINSCIVLIAYMMQVAKEEKLMLVTKSETEKLAKDAELSSLRLQLQPHFLFNSLNSIYALIKKEPTLAREMILKLSDFFRGTVKTDLQKIYNVQNEINHMQLYLDIEKIRFGDRLNVVYEISENCLHCELPALILQPAIENAIKYGVYDTLEKTEIKVSIFLEQNQLKITMQNPTEHSMNNQIVGNKFGLQSIRRRLELLYNRLDLLQTKIEHNIFTLTIAIPQ